MPQTKDEKVKLYAVIALAVVAAFIAYSRFGPKRGGASKSEAKTRAAGSSFIIPKLPVWLADFNSPLQVERAPYAPPSRDLFSPAASEGGKAEAPTAAPEEADKPEPKDEVAVQAEPALPRLSAVMMGSGGALAVIDGEILRVGHTIGAYTIEEIKRKHVILRDGKQRIMLKVGGQ
jgi:hypothetical protein